MDAIELRSHFARYLAVRISGYFEKALQELGMQCCRRSSGGPSLSFALAQLDRSRNPNLDAVLRYVGAFSPDWQNQLDSFLTAERRNAIGTVVAARNDVAHGGMAGLTYSSVRDHANLIHEVVDFLADLFDPVPAVGAAVAVPQPA